MGVATRDYALTGAETGRALERGLANAAWFLPDLDPKVLRTLQVRSDARAAADLALWLGLLGGSALVAWWSIWSWWSIPAFLVYGLLYGGAADARWHECGHGTAFRTAWLNDAVYHVASFMVLRGPTVWRWSHHRHHTDTIIVGRDAEIAFQRPPSIPRTLLAFTGLAGGPKMCWRLVRHAFGRLDADAAELVPSAEHRRVVWESRVFVAIIGAAAAWSLIAWSIVPLLFVGLPSIYGVWLMVFFGITQHAGLREDVLDHRRNTRTVHMNPVFRFLYLNMNYHVEHHLYPSVPYPALAKLHAQVKDQLAPALPSTWAAYRQIFTTFARQRRDPDYEIPLDLPDVPGAARRPIATAAHLWVRSVDGRHDLGGVDELAPGELRGIDIGHGSYVLCRLANGEHALLDGLCTHAKVHLADGALLGDQIECPKHNGRFDARTGDAVRKPVREPLRRYAIDERDGRLTTRLEAVDTALPAR